MAASTEDILELFIVALALGMDAFSLSIGMGLNKIRRNRAIQFCVFVGVFHVLMTLLGVYLGLLLGELLGRVTDAFAALLLIGLGLHMAYTTLFSKSETIKPFHTFPVILLFSAGVSLDALSVGFTLGLQSATYCVMAAFVFGVIGAILCAIGLLIGNRASGYVGVIGEIAGSLVLIGFGLHIFFD